MFAIQPTTQGPDVNQRSNFFQGYQSGWANMSDAMRRLQKKRALDQQDWALRNQERQLALAEWSAQVGMDLNYRKMDQEDRQFAINADMAVQKMGLMDRQIDLQEAVAPLEIAGAKLDLATKQKQLEGSAVGMEVIARNTGVSAPSASEAAATIKAQTAPTSLFDKDKPEEDFFNLYPYANRTISYR